MPTHGFSLELKQVSDAGTFEGRASVYGVEDLGSDLVEPGAFCVTLQNNGKERPLLWRHDSVIGVATLTDSPTALMVSGKLSMAVQAAREAHALMVDHAVRGISIGYSVVRSTFDEVKQVRRLQELRLWEVSLTPTPMLQEAQVTSVKSYQEEADYILQSADWMAEFRKYLKEKSYGR